jgi:DNA-directed RNA polymerase subunit D
MIMKIELVEKNKDESVMTFKLSDTTAAYVNALRRIIVEMVPTLAVEDVIFRKNGSILYDEILANRIGLVPIVTDLKSYVLPEKCECKGEGCAQCTLKVTLEKKGPCTVYSGDMKFADPAIKVVHNGIPLVKLLDGQELEFEATAILGRGKDHMKWAPGHAFHKNMPEITISGKVENPDEIAKACPRDIFKVKSGSLEVVKDNLTDCNLCGACSDKSSHVKIGFKPDEYLLTIETWKQLQIKEMVSKALSELDLSLDELSTGLKDI